MGLSAFKTWAYSGTESIGNTYESFSLTNNSQFQQVRGECSGIFIYLTTIAGGAASLLVELSTDSAGDKPLFPTQTVAINTGQTTATSGSVVIQVELVFEAVAPPLYCWLKTDAGTVVITDVQATFKE